MNVYLRVESRSRIFDFLNESGHVLEEEIVKVFLLHVLELEDGFVGAACHGSSQRETGQGRESWCHLGHLL